MACDGPPRPADRAETGDTAADTAAEARPELVVLAAPGAPSPPSTVAWYADRDGDGHGDPTIPGQIAVNLPGNVALVQNASDCDDWSPARHAGAEELCNGVDDDCDGDVDEDALDTLVWWTDADRDGHGAPGPSVVACERPGWTHAASDDDCDDGDRRVHGAARETCNGRDDDCDDGERRVHGAARETCNGRDDDCAGLVDGDDPDASGPASWYADGDGDGFGDGAAAVGCAPPGPGWTEEPGDCDDHDASAFPGAAERCADGVDSDCDGQAACTFEDLQPVVHGSRPIGLGQAVTALGDLDGDGLQELGVSAAHWTGPGVAIVLEAPFVGSRDADSARLVLDAERDIEGSNALAPAGDLDGDGFGDLLLYGRDGAGTGSKWAWVMPGARDGRLDSSAALARIDGVGSDAVGPGDLDGDGADDVVFVDRYASGAEPWTGEVTVFAGPLSGELALADAAARLSGDPDARLRAPFGGDLDGDGDADFGLVSTEGARGVVHLVLEPISGELPLEDLPDRIDAAEEGALSTVLGQPTDLDGDGYLDLAVWQAYVDSNISLLAGPFGGATAVDRRWAMITGTIDAGIASVAFPDVDGDGTGEIAVEAWDDEGYLETRWIEVFEAPASGTHTIGAGGMLYIEEQPFGLIDGGDLDGDGRDDLVIAMPGWYEPFRGAGAVFVLPGAEL